jgi:hypothetical protein
VKKLLLIFTLLVSFKISAIGLYGGAAYSYGVTTAESDFWNGASGGAPALLLGAKFEKFALEFQFRKYTLNNIHETSSGNYDININDTLFAVGGRYFANEIFHANFGIARHSIDVDYTTTGSARLSSGAIAGGATSFYVGGGLHGPLFLDGLKWLVDMNYIHHSLEFGLFAFDFGVTYEFLSF